MSTTYQPEPTDAFALLQLEMAEEMRSKATLADLTISVDEPEVIGSEIDNAVESSGGLLLLVEPPTGTNLKPAVFSALYMQVEIGVLVMENPELNRCEQGKRKPALACVLEILRALHGFRPRSANVMLQGLGWDFVQDPRLLSYRARFRCELAIPGNADTRERRPV